MSSNVEVDFSAREPSLGFYHQIRFALLLLSDRSLPEDTFLSIESLDDVVLSSASNGTNLIQLKHHINTATNLTDRSADFWKTIRIWSSHITNGKIDPQKTIFTLITTSTIPNNSFLHQFKTIEGNKDPRSILKNMEKIASEDSNKINQSAYAEFLKLDNKLILIQNIRLVDSSVSIMEVISKLKENLCFAALPDKLDILIQRLEGWWFQRLIAQLINADVKVSKFELRKCIDDIRETFKIDDLPDDIVSCIITIDERDISDFSEKMFVRQLRLISMKNAALKNAILDFRKAYEQRSKWLRENLTRMDEYQVFDKNLEDHWNNIFTVMADECNEMTEDELREAGKQFYRKFLIENIPPCKIRKSFDSAFLTRGSCHMLADEKRIGWHPKFKDLLPDG